MSLYYANGPDGSRASKSRWGALRRAMRSRMGSASDAEAQAMARMARITRMTQEGHELKAELVALQRSLLDDRMVREARIVADQGSPAIYSLDHERDFKLEQTRKEKLRRLHKLCRSSQSVGQMARRSIETLAPGECFPECDAYIGVLEPGADALHYVACSAESTMRGRTLRRPHGPATWRAVDHGGTVLVGHVAETAAKATDRLHCFADVDWRERQEAVRQRRRMRAVQNKIQADVRLSRGEAAVEAEVEVKAGDDSNDKLGSIAAVLAAAQQDGDGDDVGGAETDSDDGATGAEQVAFDSGPRDEGERDENFAYKSDGNLGIPPLGLSHWKVIGNRPFRRPFLAIPIRRPGGDAVLGVLCFDAFMTGARRAAAINNCRTLFYADFNVALRDTVLYRQPVRHKKQRRYHQDTASSKNKHSDGSDGDSDETSHSAATLNDSKVDLAVELQRGYVAAVNDLDRSETGKSLCESHLYTLGWEGDERRDAAARAAHPERQYTKRQLDKGSRWFEFERNVLMKNALGAKDRNHDVVPEPHDVRFAEQVADMLGAKWWDLRVEKALRCVDRSSWLNSHWNAPNPCWQDIFAAVFASIAEGVMFSASAAVWCIKSDAKGRVAGTQMAQVLDMRRLRERWNLWESRHVAKKCSPAEAKSHRSRLMQCVEWSQMKVNMSGPALKLLLQQMNAHAYPQQKYEPFEMRATPERMVIEIGFDPGRHEIAVDPDSGETTPVQVRYVLTAARSTIFRGESKGPKPRMRPSTPLVDDGDMETNRQKSDLLETIYRVDAASHFRGEILDSKEAENCCSYWKEDMVLFGVLGHRFERRLHDVGERAARFTKRNAALDQLRSITASFVDEATQQTDTLEQGDAEGFSGAAAKRIEDLMHRGLHVISDALCGTCDQGDSKAKRPQQERAVARYAEPVNIYAGILASAASEMRFVSAHSKSTDGAPVLKSSRTVMKRQVLRRADGGCCFRSADTTVGGAASDDGDVLGDGANDVTIVRDADSARKQGIVFFDRRANVDRRRGSQVSMPQNFGANVMNLVDVAVPPPPVSISWPWVCVPLCATADADATDAVAAAMKRELHCRNNIGVLCIDGFDGLPLGGVNERHPERGMTHFLRLAASVLACAVDKVRKVARLRLLDAVSIDTALPDYSRENWQRHVSGGGIYPTVEGTVYPAILKALRENIVYGIDAEVWRLEVDGSVVQLAELESAPPASHARDMFRAAAIKRVVAKAGSALASSIHDSLASMPRRTALRMYNRAKAKAIAQGDEPPLPPNDDRIASAEWQRFEMRGKLYGDCADATSMLTMAERVFVPFHDAWHPHLVGPAPCPCEWNGRAAIGVERCSATTPAPRAFTHVIAVTRAANHNAREDVHFGAQVGTIAQHLVDTVRGREARQRARDAALGRLELNFEHVPEILPRCEAHDCADDIALCLEGACTTAASQVLAYAVREVSNQLPGADLYVGLLRPRGKSIRFVACSESSVMAPRAHKYANASDRHDWAATDSTKRRSLSRELIEGQGISWKVITKGVDGWRDVVVHDDKDALRRGVHLFVRSSDESDAEKPADAAASPAMRSVGRPAAWPFLCVPVLDGDAVLGVLNVDGMDRVPIGRADEHPPERGVMPFLRDAGRKIGNAIGECRRKPAIAAINASTICKTAKDTDIYAVALQALLDVIVFAQQIEVCRVEMDADGMIRLFVVAERTVDALACNLNHQIENMGAEITEQLSRWLADAVSMKKCLSVQDTTCSRLFGLLNDPTAETQMSDGAHCYYLLQATVKEGRANAVDAQFVGDAATAASAALAIVRGREARAAARRQAVINLAEAIPSAKSEVKADSGVGSEYWFYGNGHDQSSQDAVGNYVRRVCNAALRGVQSCLPGVHACIGLLTHDAAGDAVRYACATKGSSMLGSVVRRGHGICWASIDSPGSVVMVRNSSAESRAAKLLAAEHRARSDSDGDAGDGGTMRHPFLMLPIEARPWGEFLGNNYIDLADIDPAGSDFGVRAGVPSDFPVFGVLCVDGFEQVPIGRPDEQHPEQGVLPFLGAMAAALGVGLRDHRQLVGLTRVENAWHSFAVHKLSVPPQLYQPPLAAGCDGLREMWLAALDALRINIPFAHALEVWHLDAVQNDLVSVCQMHAVGARATQNPARRRCVDITFDTAPPTHLTLVQKGAVIAGLLRGRQEALARKAAKTGAAGEPFTLLEAHNVVIAPFDADGAASAARVRARAQGDISPVAAPAHDPGGSQSFRGKVSGTGTGVTISSSSESEQSDSGEESILPEASTGRANADDTYWALAIVRTIASGEAPADALPHSFDHCALQRRREHHDALRYAADVVRRLENALRRLRSAARLAHNASASAARSALSATGAAQNAAAAALQRIDSMKQTKRTVSFFGKRSSVKGGTEATSGSVSSAAAAAQNSALDSRRGSQHSNWGSDEDDEIHTFRASEVDPKDVDGAIAAVRKGSNARSKGSRRSRIGKR